MVQMKSYFRASFALWRRQWVGVLVALAGLAVAFAISMITVFYVLDGVTSDAWLDNADRLYRIESQILANGKPGGFSRQVYAQDDHAAYIRDNFAEIEAVTRAKSVHFYLEGDAQKEVHDFYFVDQGLTEVLNLPTLAGDIESALKNPENLIVSRSKAEELFGVTPELAIGERISFAEDTRDAERQPVTLFRTYRVAAVIADIPPNSMFDFELMALRPANDPEFNSFPYIGTYFLVREGVDFAAFKPAFEKQLTENTPPSGNFSFDMFAEPVLGAQMNSDVYNTARRPPVNERTLWTVGTISLVLLLTAGFNYINVFTAINSLRGREIAVRRIAGAGYRHIIIMCLLEGVTLAGFAYGVALLLADDFTPFFTELTNASVPILVVARTPALIAGFAVAAMVGIMGALYPAYIMRRARPETLLRDSQGAVAGGRGRMRQALVAVQSFAAVGVIIGGSQIAWQMDHLLTLERGFETEGVFFLSTPAADDNPRFKGAFLKEVQTLPGIIQADVTSDTLFADRIRIGNYRNPEQEGPKQVVFKFPGPSFLPLLTKPPLVELDIDAGERQIVLPLSSALKFGFENADDAVGQTLLDAYRPPDADESYQPREYTIVAVIDDIKDDVRFGTESITIYHVSPDDTPTHIIGQAKGATPDEMNATLRAKWEEFFPDQPYEVEWLIDRLSARYKSTQDMGLILNFISVITLILSVAGLYGMARHWLLTRRRELALRRVMGAEHRALIMLAVRRMLTPIIIGGILAFVPVWLLMQEWLTSFTDKGELPLVLYGAVLAAVTLLSAVILLGHTLRALREHPAEVLYHE